MKNWIQITRFRRPEAIVSTGYGEVEWRVWLRHEAARIAPRYVAAERDKVLDALAAERRAGEEASDEA